MAAIPEPRVEQLCEIYHPKKVTLAAHRAGRYAGPEPHARGQRRPAGHDPRGRLPGVRGGGLRRHRSGWPISAPSTRTSCWPTWRSSPTASTASRTRSRSRCPARNTRQLEHEHATLKIVLAAMESGKPLRESHMTEEQQKVTRAFRLLEREAPAGDRQHGRRRIAARSGSPRSPRPRCR